MEKAKVLLLSCGEEVYPQDRLSPMIDEVKSGVGKLDLELSAFHE
jgi:hypothetical protein